MRVVASIAAVMLLWGWSAAAKAQTLDDMQLCRAIPEDSKRLACYDAIEISPAPRSKYETVDLADLKSFALSYRGQLVEVAGWIKPGTDFFFLGADAGDDHPVPIDVDSLDRRARQSFLAACGGGCEATVQGRVRPVNFTTGIVADTLVAR